MKFYILIIFLLLIEISRQAKNKVYKCDRKSENEMDKALARIIVYGQKGIRFPETVKELRPYCNDAKRMFDRVARYSDACLNKFGRDASKVLMHTMGQELRSVCKSGRINKRAMSLIEAAPCGNQGNSRFNKNCYLKLIDRIMGAMNAQVQMRIPISCCNFYEFLRCWEVEAEQVPNCTPKIRDFFIKWLSKMFEGITQLMCVVYDDSNTQCDQIVRESPERNATQKQYKSVLLPLINIAMSLSDQDFP